MFRSEIEFRDHIGNLLEEDGHVVIKEFKVPENYRIDLLARKNNMSKGIEVKFEKRGISDDINKCYGLHRLPEFDQIYVAAPKILISSDHIAYAQRLRIGLIGVSEESIEWLIKSDILKPPLLSGGSGLPNQIITPGKTFEVSKNVENRGEKVARHLEMYFMPGGPFATAEKARYKRAKLAPGESWEVVFKIRVRKSARPGKYPLYLVCIAENVERSDTVWEIEVQPEEGTDK